MIMAGSGAAIRQRQDSILAAKMKLSGSTLSEIANAIGIKKDRVQDRIKLGERFLTLDDPLRTGRKGKVVCE